MNHVQLDDEDVIQEDLLGNPEYSIDFIVVVGLAVDIIIGTEVISELNMNLEDRHITVDGLVYDFKTCMISQRGGLWWLMIQC